MRPRGLAHRLTGCVGASGCSSAASRDVGLRQQGRAVSVALQSRIHEGEHRGERRQQHPQRYGGTRLSGDLAPDQTHLRVAAGCRRPSPRCAVPVAASSDDRAAVRSSASVSRCTSPAAVMRDWSVSMRKVRSDSTPWCASKLATPQRTPVSCWLLRSSPERTGQIKAGRLGDRGAQRPMRHHRGRGAIGGGGQLVQGLSATAELHARTQRALHERVAVVPAA